MHAADESRRKRSRVDLRAATLVALAGLAAALLSASPVSAQSPADELWYSASVGAGSARFTCDPCAAGRDVGPSLRIAAGATARPGLRVGLTGGYWTYQEDELRETVRHAGLIASLDVRPGSPLHLIGGLGWVGWRSEPFDYDALDLSVGAGWSVPLTGRWAISNAVLVHAASFGRLQNGDGTAVRDVSLSLAGFEVGLMRR